MRLSVGKGVDRRGRGIAATRLDHVPHQLARRCLRRRHSGVTDLVVEPRPRRLITANTTRLCRAAFPTTRSKSDVHVNTWARDVTCAVRGLPQRGDGRRVPFVAGLGKGRARRHAEAVRRVDRA